jgi:glycosyltransferase involved in cell wall biosynthesis
MMGSVEPDGAIDVAMATYNGGRYLPAMLASMVEQHHPGLRLVVCDDGSSDGTVQFLETFDGLPVDVTRNPSNLGARDNFSRALGLTTAPYVMLADQDDVWMPDKVSLMLRRMKEIEDEAGAATPILVFSDLHIVDTDLLRRNVQVAGCVDIGRFRHQQSRARLRHHGEPCPAGPGVAGAVDRPYA